jgi:hypothetical protein
MENKKRYNFYKLREISHFKVLNKKQVVVFYRDGTSKVITGKITEEKLKKYCLL